MAKEKFETAASAFISVPTAEPKEEPKEQETSAQEGTETTDYEKLREELINPRRRREPQKETRSKHLQSLLTPSLYKQIEKIAKKRRSSINEVVNKALMLYVLETEQKQNEKGQEQ